MITPRRDPETAPVAAGYMILLRVRTDQYGNEMSPSYTAKSARRKAAQTRNGLPEPRYKYRGLGESMAPDEAEWCLKNGVRALVSWCKLPPERGVSALQMV